MTVEQLQAENAELRRRLDEAEKAVRALRQGAATPAEEAVRRSEERFRYAADALGALVYEVDLLRNARAEAYGIEHIVGPEGRGAVLSSTWWHARIHPDDLPAHLEHLARSLDDAACSSYRAQYRVRHSDGSWRDVDDSARIVRGDDGRPRQLVGAILDVTERKRALAALRESEARFRTMANTTPAIVWTADAAGTITFHNRRWLEYTGLSPERNASDWPRLVLHPEDLDRCVSAWRQALESGSEYEVEVRNRRHDGEYRWFLTRATPIRDGSGRVVEWYGSTTDIHERKQAEQALREADRRKDEFLATLAHELRNPLAPIRNGLHILRLAGADAGAAEQVHDMMERQVNHLVRLVDDLMEVSRITRGKIELRREPVELAAVVRSAVETSKPLIEAARHQLSVTLPPEPMTLEADPVRLAQVLANLLNNAAKYTEEGGQIWLGARCEGTNVVLSVRDTGRGIPAVMLPRVFNLFTQVDHGYTRAHGGLGIGLTLVRSLVELHGGSVEAHSAGPGRGSEFVVRLPLAAGRPGAHGQGRREGPWAAVGSRRILVVDDHRDAADSLGILLKYLGADVRTATDGTAALEELRTHRPSVVLLDLGMPGMDGCEVARLLRGQPEGRDITLIALTGWGQEEDRRRSREAGIQHHLVKPVDLGALQALLASLSDRQPPPQE